MRIFVKSVMTGFAFSLGAALFRKVAPKLGLDETKAAEKKDAAGAQAAEPSSTHAPDTGTPVPGSLLS